MGLLVSDLAEPGQAQISTLPTLLCLMKTGLHHVYRFSGSLSGTTDALLVPPEPSH